MKAAADTSDRATAPSRARASDRRPPIRAALPTLLWVWSLVPALWLASRWWLQLPGETWGLGFELFSVGILWLAIELVLAGRLAVRAGYSRGVFVRIACAFAMAVTLFQLVYWTPLRWTLPVAVRLATPKMWSTLEATASDVVDIPFDTSLSGRGHFVRARPTQQEGHVRLQLFEGAIDVTRAAQVFDNGVPGWLCDWAVTCHARGDWWYVYRDR